MIFEYLMATTNPKHRHIDIQQFVYAPAMELQQMELLDHR